MAEPQTRKKLKKTLCQSSSLTSTFLLFFALDFCLACLPSSVALSKCSSTNLTIHSLVKHFSLPACAPLISLNGSTMYVFTLESEEKWYLFNPRSKNLRIRGTNGLPNRVCRPVSPWRVPGTDPSSERGEYRDRNL